MIRAIARESTYRFRATFRQRWTGYLTLVVLIGLVGGVALAAVAGARRTQSSFPAYLASTNPSDLQTFTEFDPISNTGYSASVDRAVSRVPGVARAVTVIGFDGTLQVLGHNRGTGVPGQAPPSVEGSPNGGYLTTDKVTVVQGRMARPDRMDEIVMSSGAAARYGLHIGSTLPVAFYTTAQVNAAFTGNPPSKPHLVVPFKLVGIIEAQIQVIEDDDAALGDQLAVVTPALTKRLESCCAYYSYEMLHLHGGGAHEAAVASALNKVIPNLGPVAGTSTWAPFVTKAERTVRPEAVAIGLFGLIAALAALVINGQVIGRLVRRNSNDSAIVRALGAGPGMAMADGLVGVIGAVVAGSLLATAVAVALSPLAPFGPVRPVYPDRGVSFDWTVLGFGFVLFLVVLTATALLVAYRVAPHRLAAKARLPEGNPAWNRAAASAGLPPSAVLGLRSALGSGSARSAAPVRSALLGAVVAVVVIVTSITFGASLNALVSQPSLYGWNSGLCPAGGVLRRREPAGGADRRVLLDHDPAVAHWAGVYFESATRPDGRPGPGHDPGCRGRPVHALRSRRRGTVTDRAGPGDAGSVARARRRNVDRQRGRPRPDPACRRDRHSPHHRRLGPTRDGDGEWRGDGHLALLRHRPRPAGQSGPRPHGRLHHRQARREPARRAPLPRPRHCGPQPPVRLRWAGRWGRRRAAPCRDRELPHRRRDPALLAAVLAAGAVGALGLTLVASVRQRRRQFAVLKALGFTRRQLAASVAWQSSVAAVIGVIVGVPIGVALGRFLWTLFARGISAVPHPFVPVASVLGVALGAIVFANLVALLPGRVAARTRTSLLLRAE